MNATMKSLAIAFATTLSLAACSKEEAPKSQAAKDLTPLYCNAVVQVGTVGDNSATTANAKKYYNLVAANEIAVKGKTEARQIQGDVSQAIAKGGLDAIKNDAAKCIAKAGDPTKVPAASGAAFTPSNEL